MSCIPRREEDPGAHSDRSVCPHLFSRYMNTHAQSKPGHPHLVVCGTLDPFTHRTHLALAALLTLATCPRARPSVCPDIPTSPARVSPQSNYWSMYHHTLLRLAETRSPAPTTETRPQTSGASLAPRAPPPPPCPLRSDHHVVLTPARRRCPVYVLCQP